MDFLALCILCRSGPGEGVQGDLSFSLRTFQGLRDNYRRFFLLCFLRFLYLCFLIYCLWGITFIKCLTRWNDYYGVLLETILPYCRVVLIYILNAYSIGLADGVKSLLLQNNM